MRLMFFGVIVVILGNVVSLRADGIELLEGKEFINAQTIELKSQEKLRLIGCVVPELNEPWGREALERSRALLEKTPADRRLFQRCVPKVNETQSMVRGTVLLGDTDLGEELLRLGLALPVFDISCARPILIRYEQIASEARRSKRGQWESILSQPISPDQAGAHLRRYRAVRGQVRNVHEGEKTINLHFGEDWQTDFSMTIFKEDLDNFGDQKGSIKETYAQKTVTVFGWISEHFGPQIIVRTPAQIEMLP